MPNSKVSVEQWLTRLEKLNRLLGFALIGLVLLGLIAATDQPAVSRANAFQLTDSNGLVRVELVFRDGVPGLYVLDEDGNDRLSASHDSEGTALFLKDETGTIGIGVAQFTHGGGGVALHGPESKGAAVLYLKEKGSLRFYDSEGKITNQILANAETKKIEQ